MSAIDFVFVYLRLELLLVAVVLYAGMISSESPLPTARTISRGTPIQRRTPLRRSRFMRGNRNTKHARRERGHDFMAWTSQQQCMVARFGTELHQAAGAASLPEFFDQIYLRCSGRIEVDHAGCRFTQGDGTRAFDWTCLPLCERHHLMRTNWAGTLGQAGIFFRYTREALRKWVDAAIAIHHELARRARIEVPTC